MVFLRAALVVLLGIVHFYFRHLWHIPVDLIQGRPIRVDLPLPYLQLDVVLVSDPKQIKAQLFFAGTRFHDTARDQWFVPMDPGNSSASYTQRRGTIAARLTDEWYTAADVQKIAELLKTRAPDSALGEAMVPIVNSRFLQGHKDISSEVVQDARRVLNSPTDALRPGYYAKAVQAAHRVVEFSAASAPIEGLNVIDVAHNIGATANAVVKALTILRDNMGADLIDLFTRPQNTPTPNVPRIALAASTFGGLLSYPAVPRRTMFLISISKAAGKEKSLFYTFGTGVPERSCAFKHFFESFMKDLQKNFKT